MSLINQVLQAVEKRQGVSPTPVWGAQVRPVLVEPVASRSWAVVKTLLVVAVLTGLVYIYRPLSSMRDVSQVPPLVGSAAAPAHAAVVPAAKVAMPATGPETTAHLTAVAGPQLTQRLFTDWQQTTSGQALPVSRIANRVLSDPGSPAAIEEHTAAVASPAVVSDSAARPSAKAAPVKGVVSKQVKPEQEVNVLMQRAVDHEQKGRSSEALALLRQAVQQYPQSEDARQLLVSYLLEGRQDAEALALLQEGIRLYPEQLLLRKSLAKWQLSHGQPQPALETLKPAASLSAQDGEWQWMMAMASQHAGQHAEALPYFERALGLQPGQVQTYVAYAVSLQASGQHRLALEQLRLAQDLPMSERMSEFVSQRIRQLSQQE